MEGHFRRLPSENTRISSAAQGGFKSTGHGFHITHKCIAIAAVNSVGLRRCSQGLHTADARLRGAELSLIADDLTLFHPDPDSDS